MLELDDFAFLPVADARFDACGCADGYSLRLFGGQSGFNPDRRFVADFDQHPAGIDKLSQGEIVADDSAGLRRKQ